MAKYTASWESENLDFWFTECDMGQVTEPIWACFFTWKMGENNTYMANSHLRQDQYVQQYVVEGKINIFML